MAEPGSLPPTSLLISTRDRPGLAADAVERVLAGEEVPTELVIVDQSRVPNATLATLAHPRTTIRYITSTTTGLSRSRNIAVAKAQHDLLVVIDDDVLVPPEWFGIIVRALLAAGPDAVVTGRVVAGTPEQPGAFAPSLHPGTDRVEYRGRVGQDPLATFNLAMPRSAHAAAGGFDPRIGPGTAFPAGEDNDFGHRLLEAGWRIVFEPAAVVEHRAWRGDAAYADLRHAYGRGQGAFFAKHFAVGDPYMFRRWAGTLVGHLRRIPRAAVMDVRALAGRRGPRYWRSTTRTAVQPGFLRAEGAWILGFVSGTVAWLAARRRRA